MFTGLQQTSSRLELDVSRDALTTYILVLCGCLVVSVVVLASGGSLSAGVGFIGASLVIFLTLYRIDWGTYILIGSILLFSHFPVPGFDNNPLYRVSYFKNLKEITYLPYFNAGVLTLFEVHFLFVFAVWFFLFSTTRETRLRPVSLWLPGGMFFSWFLLSFGYGLSQGGDFMIGLWEYRALCYLALMFFFIPQIIVTEEQVKGFIAACMIGILLKSIDGAWRYYTLDANFGEYEALTEHEDPVFMVTLFIFVAGLFLFNAKSGLRTLLGLSLPFVATAFWAGNRRAAFASFLISIPPFIFLFSRDRLKKFAIRSIPVWVFVALYFVAGWNSHASWAAFAQQIKSGLTENTKEAQGDRNYYSNLYRKIEDYNLAVTIQRAPLVGVGAGMKYDQPLELIHIEFSLRDYMAHNNILWLLIKVGSVGFFLLWFWLDAFAFRAAVLFHKMTDPYLKAVCAVLVIAVLNQMVAAYFDLHLVRYRTMLYLGSLMALLSPLESIARSRAGKDAPPA